MGEDLRLSLRLWTSALRGNLSVEGPFRRFVYRQYGGVAAVPVDHVLVICRTLCIGTYMFALLGTASRSRQRETVTAELAVVGNLAAKSGLLFGFASGVCRYIRRTDGCTTVCISTGDQACACLEGTSRVHRIRNVIKCRGYHLHGTCTRSVAPSYQPSGALSPGCFSHR
jgi:hypothetical protein